MDRKDILNSPPDKFLIQDMQNIQDIQVYICDTFTKWIVSQINKPYVYLGNRIRLDYFLNIPLSRLD